MIRLQHNDYRNTSNGSPQTCNDRLVLPVNNLLKMKTTPRSNAQLIKRVDWRKKLFEF